MNVWIKDLDRDRKSRKLDAYHAHLQQRCDTANTILAERGLYYDQPTDRVWYEAQGKYKFGKGTVRAYTWHGYPFISFEPQGSEACLPS